MSKSFALLSVIALICLGCGDNKGTADSTLPEKEYTLRLKPTGGPVTYNVVMDMTADVSNAIGVTEEMKKTEQKAKITGMATLETKDAGEGKLTSTFKVSDLKLAEATDYFSLIGPLMLPTMETESTSSTSDRGQALDEGKTPSPFGLNLPEKPVKVGGTWEGTRKGPDGKDVRVTGKVLGTESSGGKELLKLEISGVSLSAEMKASEPMVVLFDPETGIAAKIFMKLDIDMQGLKGKATVTAERAK